MIENNGKQSHEYLRIDRILIVAATLLFATTSWILTEYHTRLNRQEEQIQQIQIDQEGIEIRIEDMMKEERQKTIQQTKHGERQKTISPS